MEKNTEIKELLLMEEFKEQLAYWEKILGNDLNRNEIPYISNQVNNKSAEAGSVAMSFPEEITEKILKLSSYKDLNLLIVLSSILKCLLNKYTAQSTSYVITPVLKDNDVNKYNKSTVIKSVVSNTMSFKNVIVSEKNAFSEAYKNSYYPMEVIMDRLGINKENKSNIFNVGFIFENVHDVNHIKDYKFELLFRVTRNDNTIHLEISYDKSKLKSSDIEDILNRYVILSDNLTKNIDLFIGEIEAVSEEEKNKILNEFNKTEASYEKEKTIQYIFEEQVEKTPNNIAVIFEDSYLTYAELNKKSNQLALKLRERGVKSNVIVGIMVERSLEIMVGIMAILKAGGAYLPISPQYPISRIEYIVENSGMKLLLTQSNFIEKTEALKENIDIINLNNKDMFTGNDVNLEYINTSKDLAYIIYTSGSTGNPKGVMIEHHSVINRLNWMQNKYPITENDVILQKTPFTFDVSVWELFWWSFVGAKVCMLCPDGEKDPEAIIDAVNKYNVTTMHFVPSMLSIFLSYIENSTDKKYIEDLSSLKQVFSSGEALNVEQVNRFNAVVNRKLGAKLSNLYGPTEATVDVTYFDCSEGQELKLIPIGKPIDNIKLYILNENKKLQPVGVQGELYISGVGVARGYLNREELTKEKFVDNPFEPGTKMYRTGDLAKWLSDGNIEYLGRIDNQVKIRGLRIEIGEIETQLLKSEEIKEAVVIDRCDSNGEKYLCAYVTSDEEISSLKLREELLEELPAYMIPNYILQIEKLPLTANGKLDREALPEPDVSQLIEKEYEEARNKIEEYLVKVWEEVLGIEGIGISHNYYELGGDSIKSIQIVSRLQKYDISIQVKDIMENPTIKQLSEKAKYKTNEIDQGTVEGEVELAPIQKWFFENEFSQNNHWNQAFVLYKKDRINEGILRRAFVEIVKHHDALRMIYEKDGDKIKQKNRGLEAAEDAFTLDVYDLKEDENYKNTIEDLSNRLQEGMDLEKGILVKLGIFKTKEGDYLLIAIHHMVVDGVSWRILFEDLETLYEAIEMQKEIVLPQKTTSYKEWTEKLLEYANRKEILRELEYWRNIEKLQVKELPRDFEKCESVMEQSNSINITFTREETERLLRKTSTAYNTQINDILLCSLGLAVKEWSGNEKILISLEGHGREEIIKDISIGRTIGWFTSMYPVILDMACSENISYSIQNTKETLRHIPNNGIGYGLLKYLTSVEYKENADFKLKPEIIFNYLGELSQKEHKKLFNHSELTGGISISNKNKKLSSIDINSFVSKEELKVVFNYSVKEYKEETIEELIKLYKNNLIKIIEHCESKKGVQKTPWDYGDNDLSIADLNRIVSSKKSIEKIHSLAPMQEGILYNSMINKGSYTYFEQFTFEIAGTLKLEILQNSINSIVEKHEILRTAFFYDGITKPKQAVLIKREIIIDYEDISSLEDEKKKEYIEEFKKRDRDRGFDLTKDCLIRVSVIKIKDKSYKLVYSFHHIIMDGWCIGIIIQEAIDKYEALCLGEELVFEKTEPYSKYLEWLDKQDKSEALEYWKSYLNEYKQEVILPTLTRKSNSFNNKEEVITLETALTSNLKGIAEANNITINAVLQTAWGIVLQKYNSTYDVVFGSVISGRPSEVKDIEKMVGLFINTVPVRIKREHNTEFKELAKKLNQDFIEANVYNYCSLAEVQSLTDMKNKLINHIVVYENYPLDEKLINTDMSGKTTNIVDFEGFEQINYDFGIVISPGSELSIRIMYNENIYSKEIINSIGDNLYNVLNSVALNPNVKLSEIDMISEEEKNKILNEFNKTEASYEKEKTIQYIFEEQVEKTPNNIAVIFEDSYLTYAELNKKSNQLALKLRERGVKSNVIVGIMVERSLEMMVGIMATLKAGGAYLPISPQYPISRIEYIVENSGMKLLLTQSNFIEKTEALKENIDIINLNNKDMFTGNDVNLEYINTSKDLAYIIYTSGSTGNPKGVMIEHHSVINRLNWMQNKYPITENDVILQKTPFTFDVSVWELFWWSFVGAKVCMLCPDGEKDPEAIIDAVNKYNVTTMHFVPSMLSIFLSYIENSTDKKYIEDLSSLKQVFSSGEALNVEQVNRFNAVVNRKLGAKLSNLYGPTEATVDVTYFDCSEGQELKLIPIGKPIDNIKLYILNENKKLQPVGVQGELYISGVGVARGYLNREELTKEKFVDNPFEPGTKMYRTGDLAKWLSDGNIEYLGRIDNQVKIRGLRIEIGEIETQLLKSEEIKEAVVIDRCDSNGEKYLCAYVTSDEEISSLKLREELLEELPAYMIPNYILQIEKLPLTANGKLDREALPEPDVSQLIEKEYEEARNKIEEYLVKVWEEVLGIEGIGISHNYYELGGDSIKSIQIVSRLQKYDISIQVKDIMENPTIKQLSEKAKYKTNEIDQGTVEGEVELAPIQKWFFENEFSQNNHWNQAFVLYKKDRINEGILRRAFVEIVKHHDALRMIYEKDGDKIKQKNRGLEAAEDAFTLDVYDLKEDENYKNTIEDLSNRLQEGMDLEKGILVKLGIFNTKEGDYLLIAIHHMVVDGVSWRILFEDLETLYEAIEMQKEIVLPQKTTSYKEWIGKLLEYANSRKILKEFDYWRTIENTEINELPRDFEKSERSVKESRSIAISFSKEETERLLRKTSAAYNTQINDILLCSLGLAVKEWSGNDKVLISLEGHGREEIIKDVSIDRTIGWFTSMYPVILDMTYSEDISYAIQHIKEILRHIPNNGIGYGLLKYLTNKQHNDGTCFEKEPGIIFNYLGEFSQSESNHMFKYSELTGGMTVSLENKKINAIEINGVVLEGKLELFFNYSIKEYKEETIVSLLQAYKTNTIKVIEHCENKEKMQKTPWDYGDRELSIEDLNKILLYDKNIETIHSLVPMQEGMLYNLMFDKNSHAYFEQSVFALEGALNVEVLQDSINILIERHEILRTAFFYEGLAKPKQAVLRKREISVNYQDISSLDEAKKQEYIEEFKKTDKGIGFDLTKDCLVRVSVIMLEDNSYKLIYSFHHLIMDGWCTGIIMQEAIDTYKALIAGEKVAFEKTEPYSKYLEWLDRQDKSEALEYWKSYLNDYKQEAVLPMVNKKIDCFDNKEEIIILEKTMTSKLKGLAETNNITINSVIQAAWGILLQKYNNTDDVVFGSVISGRPSEVKDIEKMVGLFINTVPVRIKGDNNTEFKELAKKLNEDFIEANIYNYCSLAEVQSLTDIKNKLINHIVVYENYPMDDIVMSSSNKKSRVNVTNFENFEQTNYDFGIIIVPGDELNIKITYNGNSYSEEIIKSIRDNLYNLLNSIALNPSVKLSELDMVSMKEKDKLLNEFNNNKEMPSEKTIQELFEEQVEKTPDNIAIVLNDKKLTYRELNEKSNSLGRALREKGVREEKIVGIIMDRSIEMILGIMGILKAGGAYLPIDPEYPIDRIKYMLEDSKAEILLTQNKVLEAINYDWKSMNIEIIEIEDNELYEKTGINLEKASKARNLAYVIYTSGTTGKPKGVMIEHRSAAGTLLWRREEYKLDEKDKVLVLFSYAFDGFVTNFFTTIISGAAAVLVKSEESKDAFAIKKCIEENKITHFICVPILYGAILECSEAEDLESLRIVTLAGDKTSEKLIKLSRSKNEKIELVNEYGPTENSVASTVYRNMEKIRGELVPIGKPRVGTKVYIVDKNNFLMPIGTIGELCVAGNGLARGYLNREELTAEKFVTNQFESDTKMYRTGDLARWLPDGNIEFVGRMDNQVKVRGFRVELGEIENQLLKLEGIKEAAVVDRNSENGDVYIAAYITAESEIAASAIKEELSNELPSYMIPSYIMKLEELPVTVNGKIDRKALPEPDVSEMVEKEYEKARNKTEEYLVKVWEEVLGIEFIGISHNYYELGGDSIKSIQIVSRLQKYNISLNVKDIMENPTIKQLSEKAKYKNNEVDQGTIEGETELAPIQKWFFENEFSQKNNWNQAFVFYKKDGIKKEIIKKSFVEIIKHHDALRMIYEKDGDKIKQKNRGLEAVEDVFTLDVYDLKKDENYKNTIEELSSELQEGMDLEKGILLKLGLFNTKEGDYLLIAIHHMIVDGISWRILLEDLETLYSAIENNEEILLPKKTTSYKEWTRKLLEYANSRKFLKELEYWKSVENTEVREIPRDFPKSESTIGESQSIYISFSKEETERLLRKTSTAYNTQINDILLCSLGLAVKEWSGNNKVLISLEGHGREEIIKDVSIDRTIGWFTSIYPVILDMTYSEDISYVIQYTKETLRHIPNNGIGYGILKYLTDSQKKKDVYFKLKPEISFNYLGEFVQKESKDSFRYSELAGGMSVSTTNKKLNSIEINGFVSEGKLEVFLNYSTKEYKEETVINLLEEYKRNLIKVVEHCEGNKEIQKTPWDYGDKELSIEDLNKILSSGKDIEKIHSLAPMQEGMLYNLILDKNSHAYFEQSVFTLEGTLRVEILNKVFNTLIEKYDILRTAFFYDDISKPKQAVLKKREMIINYEDINAVEALKQEEYIEILKNKDRDKGFDLTNDCLIRILVIKVQDNKYKLIYNFHHIIMDGWCIGIIMNDIVNMYKALCEEKEITIGRTESYNNYLEWLDKQDKSEALEYWKTYLSGYGQEAVIPKLNKKSQSFNSAEEEIILDDVLTGKLKRMAEKNNITMNAVIQTAWGILLQKYNNTDDVVFGSVISGRTSEITDIESIVGLFINAVPIRVAGKADIQFRELAQKLNKDFIEANMYGYCSLAEVQALTDMKNKLINHITVYENYPINEEMMNSHGNKKSELSIIDVESFEQTNYDLAFVITPGSQLNIKLTYNSNVYDKKIMREMLIKVYNILSFISYRQECRLSEIDIITEEEQEKLLYEFNNTKTNYPKEKTIQELFEEQVEKNPNNIAVTFKGKELTYKELNEKANSLGGLLRKNGVSSEKVVGIMVDRSLDMLVGIMAILKAGGAYLPIDTEYPEERISYMLEDSGTKLLLTKKSLLKDINFEGEIIDLEDQENYTYSKENIEKTNTSSGLAYIIYTSGSTGKPKGTKIMHYSVTRVVKNTNYISINKEDTILQLSSYAFDGSVFDIYGALLNGAKLAIIDKDSLLNIDKLSYFIQYNKVSMFFITTALFNTLVDNKIECLKNIRKVLFGGERISILHTKKALDYMGKDKIIHVYGPTESTVFSNYYFINNIDENAENIPIGKPISNSTAYILGKDNELKPIGIPGELCIGGDGLAIGYLNNLELTKEKFVDNPFEPGTKMYKTGDLARWLPDGNIEYLGRIDNQIKIRGFRIELGEIESQLSKVKNIKEVAVVSRNDENGDKYLCAYITAEKEVAITSVKEELSKKLPAYMMPGYIIQIDKFPLTSNGKIDRKALPEIDKSQVVSAEYEAPGNKTEEKLVKIWERVLGRIHIGINDNYFDLGGHSLKATVITAQIKKELGMEVKVRELFENPTIKTLSEAINQSDKKEYIAIDKAEEKEYYKVSSAEKRLFAVWEMDKKSIVYNIPMMLEINEELDKEKIVNTLNELIRRHEALRTRFKILDGKIVQKVEKKWKLDYIYEELEISEVNNKINNFIRPFDLTKAPLMRAELIKYGMQKYIFMLDFHHIIVDGVSTSVLMDEFINLYKGEKLSEPILQYKDYSEWQNTLEEKGIIKGQEEYWMDRFTGEIPVLNIQTDYERPNVQSYEGDRINFTLDKKTTDKLNNIAKDTGTTLYTVLLSAYNILLSKYSGQEDIIVGTAQAGRPKTELENVVGMFVNTVALRNYPKGDKTFKEFLKEVRDNTLKDFENTEYQFESLLDKLDLTREASRNPLFDTMFVLENIDFNVFEDNGKIKSIDPKLNMAKFDLTLTAMEIKEGISFSLEYCTKLFVNNTIKKIWEHFVNILEQIVFNPNIKLNEINMLSKEEENKLVHGFNYTKTEYPRWSTIQELFEEQVDKSPNDVAVSLDGKELTYRELNEKANSLARALREKDIKTEKIVGIMVEPSLETIIGIVAILKAGGAYLPIDPEYPIDRIKYMLEDSNTKLLLTKKSLLKGINFDGEIIAVENQENYVYSKENIKKTNDSRNLAYIIYTSGSTGMPKGVLVEHRNVVRLVKNTNYLNLKKSDRILQTGSVVFDASTFEIWGSLLNGGSLYLIKKEDVLNSEILANKLDKYKITTLWLTSALFSQLSQDGPEMFNGIKNLLVGGDALSPKHINLVRDKNKHLKVINGYGPTENTTFSTTFLIEKNYENNIPIGKPISNSTVYIVGKNNELKPIGVPGELCVGGDGVARGYLNNLELTKEKFVDNPFEPGAKMYKTGDLARWLPDGNIEYLGRIDNQIKIRGFRIELGEIENQLSKVKSIKEAVVVSRNDDNGDKYLCAYITAEEELIAASIKEELSKKLPAYMVPGYIVQIDKMPLTSNGKIDKKALPEIDKSQVINTEYEAPRDKNQEKLVEIWERALGRTHIGINDNYFDLGGHSLKAAVITAQIKKELGLEVKVRELFENPTIKTLSEAINQSDKKEYIAIDKAEEKEYYKASSAEKRLFAVWEMDKTSTVYNIPMMLEINEELDKEKIVNTLNELIRRHEALRTSFKVLDGEIVQKVEKEWKLDYIYEELESSEVEDKINNFIRPFDLIKAPLMRAELIKYGAQKYIFMIDFHHIIVDGVSTSILMDEFVKLYRGEELSELELQYKDYAQWQNTLEEKGIIKGQEEYWINRFKGEIPVLNIQTDYERPNVQSYEGDRINFTLDQKTSDKLNNIAKDTGTTLYTVLLSAYNILLSKYSGQEDIIVGTAQAGRPKTELENVVGMFVNTVALRNYPKGDKTFKEFLKEVRDNTLKDFENTEYQFESLLDKLDLTREASRNPLFDTMFVLENIDFNVSEDNGKIKSIEPKLNMAKFDLTLTAMEIKEGINFSLEYCSKLFVNNTIKKMWEHFVNILEQIVLNPNIKLHEINMLSKEEENKLVHGFNDTKTEYPRWSTIQELFEEQVDKAPNDIAVSLDGKELTYRELNEKANSLGGFLRKNGVSSEKVVGIMVDRSLDMLVGIMGILKAGGAYLPIDTEYPEERISYMLEDSGTKLLLTKKSLLKDINFEGKIIDLEAQENYAFSKENIEKNNTSSSLAYIIYTSGSTGKPKGTKIMHYSVTRVVKNTNYISINKEDTILQLSSYAFDGSVFDIYGALLNGAKLVMIDKDSLLNIDKLSYFVQYNKVSIFFITTALFNTLVDNKIECLKNIRKVLFGGERISILHAKKALDYMGKDKMIHVYGPTESTVFSNYYFINNIDENAENIPIGKPISNSTVYILGKHNELKPIGVAGELCIGGDGLARGYLNNLELTKEKFVDNPFEPGTKMYKTGDLARWLPDGNIEYLGRIDNQIKIRGFRIELGEIENQLSKVKNIKEAVVVSRNDDNGDKYLCAYITAEKELIAASIKEELSKKLPSYMVPGYIVQIDKMPLTSNGKIDRKALPGIDKSQVINTEYEAPRNKTEEKLAEIWKRVLGRTHIGINDNYFDLGGHSLKAAVITAQIKKELGLEVKVRELFENPTIKTLSEAINQSDKKEYIAIDKAEEKEYYKVSSAEKRLFAVWEMDKKSIVYNIPMMLEINEELDKEKIVNTLNELIRRHEALRTSFKVLDGEIVQKVEKEWKLDYIYGELENSELEDKINNFIRPFNLTKAPLMRAELIKYGAQKYIFMIDFHHIIVDGVSTSILMDEFVKLYRGEELSELELQYKDYAQWQNTLEEKGIIKGQEEYWINRFKGEIPVLNIQTDYERPNVQSYEGDRINFTLDQKTSDKLNNIAKDTGTTLYTVLLSAYNILLSKYSGQEDIIVGTAQAGRPKTELENVVGMFVNTVALRNYPKGDKTFKEFLKEVRDNTLKDFENTEYQFESLLDKLDLTREASRNPLFDTMFVLQNIDLNLSNDKGKIKSIEPNLNIAKFDLTLTAVEIKEGISFSLEYCTNLFKKEKIEAMTEHFISLIQEVINNMDIQLCEIKILSDEEMHKYEKYIEQEDEVIIDDFDFSF